MKLSKWENRWLHIAVEISTWSKDPSTRVGCVIVKNNRILSTGYNGLPPGVTDDPAILNDRAVKLKHVLHAEMNAMAFAPFDISGATLFCTAKPCGQCTSMLIARGITRVVALPNKDYETRYADELTRAAEMLDDAQVVIDVSCDTDCMCDDCYKNNPCNWGEGYPWDDKFDTLFDFPHHCEEGSTQHGARIIKPSFQCKSCLIIACSTCRNTHDC